MVGLNGSGKTTLFKLILGLLEPEAGEIYVFDRARTRKNLWQVRQEIGFLFQNLDDQLFALTVWEDVAFGPRNQGLSEDEVEERIRTELGIVQMSDFRDRPVNQMSHGQAKRVALAGVVAMRPRILFLDEPFTGIDFPMVRRLVKIIEDPRNEDMSVLYTTHNRFFLENWADSVLVLRNGSVLYDGSVNEALAREDVLNQIGNWEHLKQDMIESRNRVRNIGYPT
ncbi:MAG: ABC transporter ATP-binding protein [Candidatus Thorarchaeota archaeon]|nr:ABC transporter ATP-binding protein [Candidatus Thorarchaeota archaeon]